ncbi:MAG: hypothetical protein MSD82_06575 [Prevotella sp.]|nr:hypothetical protein [Prevotella sp.]
MKTKLILCTLLMMLLASCHDDHIDPNTALPTIQFPLTQLNIDLNKVDNLPVIAIIKSEAGLKKVDLKIETEAGVVHYKTITEFYNVHNYSLAETPEYQDSYKSVTVEATDLLDRSVSALLPLQVTGIIARPVIEFDPDSIVYDEREDNPQIPHTKFTVTSEAGLKSVEMYLVSKDGQELKGRAELSGEKDYQFDGFIPYTENDKGFKVKAEDKYGNTTISTLPVIYKTLAPPVLTLAQEPISGLSGEAVTVPISITSQRGVSTVDIYLVESGKENLAEHLVMGHENTLNLTPSVVLTAAATKLKIVVSDGRKETVGYVKVYVDMKVATLYVGSQPIANTAHKNYPGAFGMASLKDMKTYSVDYAINGDNSANIDFKFYCFGGQAVPRLYSMDNTEKSAEYGGTSGKLTAITVKNATRFAVLSNFDYDNATTVTIGNILSSSITLSKLTPFSVGDVIAFRTGNTSTSGGGKIGVMKVVNIISAKELGSANATANILVVEIKMPIK